MIAPRQLAWLMRRAGPDRLARRVDSPDLRFLVDHGPFAWRRFADARVEDLKKARFPLPGGGTLGFAPSPVETRGDAYALHMLCGKNKPLKDATLERAMSIALLDETLSRPVCASAWQEGRLTRFKFFALYLVFGRLLRTECVVQGPEPGVGFRVVTSYGGLDGRNTNASFPKLCSNIAREASIAQVDPARMKVLLGGHSGHSRPPSVPDGSSGRAALPVPGNSNICHLPFHVKENYYSPGECLDVLRTVSRGNLLGLAESQVAQAYRSASEAFGRRVFDDFPIPLPLWTRGLVMAMAGVPGGLAHMPKSWRGKEACMAGLLAERERLGEACGSVPPHIRDDGFLFTLIARRPEYLAFLKEHERTRKLCRLALERLNERESGCRAMAHDLAKRKLGRADPANFPEA